MTRRAILPLLLLLVLLGCSTRDRALSEYSAFNDTPRVILPNDWIDYLKREKFTRGELDGLPTGAIILHHDDVEGYLKQLGYGEGRWRKLQTGATDPNVMYVVYLEVQGAKDERFDDRIIVNRGLPGAGGISTQAAELAALGVKQIIHIGTAGFVGDALPDRALVVSDGSYKDGGAVLLSDRPDDRIARPDTQLAERIRAAAKRLKLPVSRGVGYTSPIFYYQPSGLIRQMIDGPRFARQRPAFVEMEQAPLFETARRANVAAASIVVGSDRYRLESGELKHDYFESTTEQELAAMRIAIEVLAGRAAAR